ncbi:hypothetical protein EYZ11_012663 [Aspergillus tanneri]|uniref:HMG box domain-containing protein n=1 Tax=Aspergillus tanneri TaxID=1220188 RepID=A0A4S3J067_9EURO|nr:uncharacterized protein ATNIH1004_001529 [Aspergillus tanneri]KAA8652624.1 hypothetical protein ATNIH1004_001529 [Aspergillus tanneri]THC87892.1 hypothetical protein EYZ11_012663 [Aspergillus tanneri]
MTALPIDVKSTVDSTDKLTELLWQDALRHLESTNNEVLLPINITDLIGQRNVDKIKSRLGALIGAPVVAFVDESINALRVMRTPAFSGTNVSVASHDIMLNLEGETTGFPAKMQGKSSLPTKSAKVPRPPNAFILYRQYHHSRVKEAYPAFSNNEISVILGKQWKAEPDDVKVQFRQQAEELKKKHAEEHPDYHYSPRKPSERKRRASSRQHHKTSQCAKSPLSANKALNVSTPTMYPEIEMGMPVDNILDPLNMIIPSEQFDFDSATFNSLIQQVHEDYNKANLFPPHMSESLEFSDFITDCY